MNQETTPLVPALKGLLNSIQAINQLLQSDLNHFVHHRAKAIIENNDKKQAILTNMQQQLSHIENMRQALLRDKPEQTFTMNEMIAMLPASEATLANQYRQHIQEELKSGSNQINCNSHLIVSNLNYLHEIYRKLTQIAEHCHTTYEKPSNKME